MEERTDIVYILGSGSKWHNNELRHSLRSLGRLEGKGQVFIVGECPPWIDRAQVTHIREQDRHHNKLLNAIDKISTACTDRRISESFLLMNDDFYFLKRTKAVRSYTIGTLWNMERRHETRGGYYYDSITRTRKILCGMEIQEPKAYEAHYPMIFEKSKFLKMRMKLEGLGPYLFRSAYGNMNRVEAEDTKDFKCFDLYDLKRLKDGMFLSSDNKIALAPEFQRWLRKKFCARSKYEYVRPERWYATKMFTFRDKLWNPGDIVAGDVPEIVLKSNCILRRTE